MADSSSMSSVTTAVVAVSRGGEGDLRCGEPCPVARSSSVALALERKELRKVTNKVKI